MGRARVLLADDHVLVAEGISRLLAENFDLVAQVSDGRELLAAVAEHQPDVALVDISMPHLNGIEAVRLLTNRYPSTRAVILTMHSDPEYVRAALNAGAKGYVLKRAAPKELMQAIQTVMDGSIYLSEPLTVPTGPVGATGEILTSRQREVLQLIAEGFSAKQIAGELHISVKTVEFHKTRMLERVGARTTADLIRYAVEHGMTVKNSTTGVVFHKN